MLRHFLYRDFDITPNSTAGYETSAVEAPRLAGRYSADHTATIRVAAGVALDLWGDYSPRSINKWFYQAGVARDLWGDYSGNF